MNYSKSELRDHRDATLKMRAMPVSVKLTWKEYLPFLVLCFLIVGLFVAIA
ncbi:MAG: hypothetical protein Q7S51_05790 [Gallionellaceae bacterium]|nr:hypothetical protein [Gallionellaceae bacterium]